MNQNHLNNLALMSMEYELLRKLRHFRNHYRFFSKKNQVNITREIYIVELSLICYVIYAAIRHL